MLGSTTNLIKISHKNSSFGELDQSSFLTHHLIHFCDIFKSSKITVQQQGEKKMPRVFLAKFLEPTLN